MYVQGVRFSGFGARGVVCDCALIVVNLVVSINKGTPIWTPKY